jgi:outer membrane protein assembly factor BamB
VGNYDGVFLKADIGKGEVLWRHPVPDAPILTSPAIGDQVVVFGARDKQVHCLRQQDGERVWTFKALDNVDSSPAICDGKVVFGSDDGRLYIVRVTNGSLVWSYLIGKPITSSPAVAYGVVVVGCDDGSVYAFGEMR